MVTQKTIFTLPPVRIAAVILALALYARLVKPADPHTFRCCMPLDKLGSVSGLVASNPSKTSSGRFYSLLLDAERAGSADMSCSARGRVRLLVPCELVEALYPGKLFSLSKKDVPVEQGARLVCTVRRVKESSDAGTPPSTSAGGARSASVATAARGAKSGTRGIKSGTPSVPVFIAETTSFAGWKNGVCRLRALSRLYLKRVLYAWGDAGGLLLALVSGSREYTDEKLAQAFQNAGLAHILALSGMHLSLFISAASFSKFFVGKKAASFFSLILMCAFIWFAGASPSLVRAFLCVFVALIARFLFIELSEKGSFDCLCAAFIVQTAFLHADIYSAAFMLSYAAIAGILLISPLVRPFLCSFLPQKFAESASATAGAWLATSPLTAMLFGHIAPVGLISSIIVTPLASVFFIAGCIGVLFCLILPFLLYPLNGIMHVLYAALKYAVLFFARFKPIDLL